ncbi:hypothetical protein SDC9_162150 [bioreactor metagenome]|uniref:Uncharacterized protein n=1 Tax=bioreactor metagenome TaxID=1076179 RepID=A0A645FKB3_9ZZZZ
MKRAPGGKPAPLPPARALRPPAKPTTTRPSTISASNPRSTFRTTPSAGCRSRRGASQSVPKPKPKSSAAPTRPCRDATSAIRANWSILSPCGPVSAKAGTIISRAAALNFISTSPMLPIASFSMRSSAVMRAAISCSVTPRPA